MQTGIAISNEMTSAYSHDFLGGNIAQRGDGNQFVDETRIISRITCITTLLGASMSAASQQAVSDWLD
jgi:hypothetical protein